MTQQRMSNPVAGATHGVVIIYTVTVVKIDNEEDEPNYPPVMALL